MDAGTQALQIGPLTEAIYDAALEPLGWGGVMRQMHALFRTTSETFYLLDPLRSTMRAVHVEGIPARWLGNFSTAYFSPDNPWIGLSERLHQPGVVRTNERLIDYTHDREVLYRSHYYNEWMRPQGFRYTIGNTLVREPGLIANVTLLRPPDMPTFAAAEVRAFEQLTGHMTRALRIGLQIEALQSPQQPVLQALDALPQAVLLLDPQACVLYANASAEELLRGDRGLALQGGRLTASRADEQHLLDALLRQCAAPQPWAAAAGSGTVTVRARQPAPARPPLTLSAIPLPEGRAGYRAGQRAILVLAVEANTVAAVPDAVLRGLYGLTSAETRLAQGLAAGHSVRAAAERAGITYGTARGYLKALFEKTGTHRQADLVKCLLRQTAPALGGRG